MGLNRLFNVFLLLLVYHLSVAQNSCYFVAFTDKHNTTFSIDRPEEFLSQKAIQRRIDQHIKIDQFDLPISTFYLQQLQSLNGIRIINKSKWLNGVLVEINNLNSLEALNNFAFIKRIQPICSSSQTEKSKLDLIAHSQNKLAISVSDWYGVAFNQIQMHNTHFLHRLGYSGKGIDIAVFDAGFPNVENLSAFESLRNQNRILGTYDFVNMETDVSNNLHFHGTLVLSCMAAYLPGEFVGTAPDANYYLFVTEDEFNENLQEEYNWAAAAEYADSVGVDIINSSLGYTTFDDSLQNHSYSDLDGNTTPITIAADIAASRGIIVVNSAGNSGAAPWQYIGAPADADSILSVGAVDANGNYAFFSSKGPASDGDLKPNVAAQGFLAQCIWPDGTIIEANGTSFSSPIIAGMTACLWQAFRQQTNMTIIEKIQESSSQFTQPDTLLGYGIPNFLKAYELLGGQVDNSLIGAQFLGLYPNPFIDHLQLNYYAVNETTLKVKLFKLSGELLYESKFPLVDGVINTLHIDDFPKTLPSAVYILRIQTDEQIITKKIVRY